MDGSTTHHTAANPVEHVSPNMPANLSPSEFYRCEAARLRRMAKLSAFSDVRQTLLSMAQEYDLLADQREGLHRHTFGQPLYLQTADGPYPAIDGQQDNTDNSGERQRIG